MPDLSGVVIVTGAASGLGRECATHFADCGATVVAADRNEAGLGEIAGERIHPVVADLTKEDACKAVADKAASLGKITGLLNSAGIELHGSVVEMPEADWDKVFAINSRRFSCSPST